jgi:hypothetical protein
MAQAEPSNVTVVHDAHVTDPTIAQDQTVTEYTVLWHHIHPNTNVYAVISEDSAAVHF